MQDDYETDLAEKASSGIFSYVSHIPLILASVATLLGAIALYFSLKDPGGLTQLKATIEPPKETLSTLSSQVGSLETQSRRLQEDQKRLHSDLQSLIQQTQATFDKIHSRYTQLQKNLTSHRKPETQGRQTTLANRTTDPNATELYTIQSGDTFSKLAKRFKVSLAAILNANPDVDPHALQIGQQVVVPSP